MASQNQISDCWGLSAYISVLSLQESCGNTLTSLNDGCVTHMSNNTLTSSHDTAAGSNNMLK